MSENKNRSYFGKYRGRVVDVNDPEQRCRLKVEVQTLGQLLEWAEACLPAFNEEERSDITLPALGQHVWVEFEQGNIERPIWVGVLV